MKLVDLTISEFMEVLGSAEPAPGGGSAAALSGAMGISLAKMVGELTINKKKYEAYETETQKLLENSSIQQEQLLAAIDKDTEAFNVVSDVFSMPKGTDEEKEQRSLALQNALKGAAISPFELMESIVFSLSVVKEALGKSNSNAASDLGVAALSLKAGLQGAWLNVLINLSSIKDQTFVAEYQSKGQALLAKGCLTADDIYEEILETI